MFVCLFVCHYKQEERTNEDNYLLNSVSLESYILLVFLLLILFGEKKLLLGLRNLQLGQFSSSFFSGVGTALGKTDYISSQLSHLIEDKKKTCEENEAK